MITSLRSVTQPPMSADCFTNTSEAVRREVLTVVLTHLRESGWDLVCDGTSQCCVHQAIQPGSFRETRVMVTHRQPVQLAVVQQPVVQQPKCWELGPLLM